MRISQQKPPKIKSKEKENERKKSQGRISKKCGADTKGVTFT